MISHLTPKVRAKICELLQILKKRRHLVKSLFTFQLTVFRASFLMVLTQIQSEVFFYQPVNTNKSNFVSFLVFVGAAASFTAIISFFEMSRNEKSFYDLAPKQ